MRENSYPRFAEHLNLHGGFTTRMVEIQVDCIEETNTLSVGTLNFFNYWIKRHILTADADCGRFAASKATLLQRRSNAEREQSFHPTAYEVVGVSETAWW